jgi:secreted trypsin-like serine protease
MKPIQLQCCFLFLIACGIFDFSSATDPPKPEPIKANPTKGVGCGRSAPAYPPSVPSKFHRIIGGGLAKPHLWPWQLSLRRSEDDNEPAHYCGGTLLRVREDKEESDIVLTAAHCVPLLENGEVGNFSNRIVVAGGNTKYTKSSGEEIRNMAEIKVHEQYANKTNDLAMIRLETPIKFSDTIRPICLPHQNDSLPIKRTCFAVGWGRNESLTRTAKDELKQAAAPVHAVETCQKTWKWQEQAWAFAFLCAGPLDGSSAVCNGDSGGPLICKDEEGKWVQQGVASYVASGECAALNQPPVFVRLANYADWVQEKSQMSKV